MKKINLLALLSIVLILLFSCKENNSSESNSIIDRNEIVSNNEINETDFVIRRPNVDVFSNDIEINKYEWFSLCLSKDNKTTTIEKAKINIVKTEKDWFDCQNCSVLVDENNENSVFLIGTKIGIKIKTIGEWYSDSIRKNLDFLCAPFENGFSQTKGFFFNIEKELNDNYEPWKHQLEPSQFIVISNSIEETPDFHQKSFNKTIKNSKRNIYFTELNLGDFGIYQESYNLITNDYNPLLLWKGDLNQDGYNDFIFQVGGKGDFSFKLFISNKNNDKMELIETAKVNYYSVD